MAKKKEKDPEALYMAYPGSRGARRLIRRLKAVDVGGRRYKQNVVVGGRI